MSVIVWPVDAVTGAPSYTGRSLRETLAPLLAGATAARPLGARSGVRPGTSATTVTATSTIWTLNACAGILDMETAVEAGPYAFAINTAQTGAVTAADATRPRVDIVWVRLDDPAESDGSSVPAVVAGYTAGAPLAGSPVAPATPARCMVLATLQVPMSGGGSPTVIWVAPCTVAAGAPIPVANQAARGALTPYDGLRIYRLDLHCVQTYNGTQWLTTDSFIGADASMVFGTALTDWDTPKIRLDFIATVTTGSGGSVTVPFTTAFAHGVSFYTMSPAASTSALGTVIPESGWVSLTQVAGIGYTKTGVALASGLSVSVAVQAVGW